MKINTGVPAHDLRQVGLAAKAAQDNGFSGISTQENRQDAFLPLAVAATQTDDLEIRTNIAIAFARSPMVAANQSWDLQRASNGRFTLGIGSQVKGTICAASVCRGVRRRHVCASTCNLCALFGTAGRMALNLIIRASITNLV